MGSSSSRSEIKVTQLSLPQGGGTVKGMGETFQPNAFSGTAQFTVSLPFPQARALTPEWNLQYSSGSGNGIFGLGFQLSLPHISRKTERGLPTYTEKDTFVLSSADDLIPIGSPLSSQEYIVQRYQPRNEGAFAKIERWSKSGEVFWKVTTAEAVTHTYGQTAQARIADPHNPERIFNWLLEKSVDAKGNEAVYFYKKEDDVNVPPSLNESAHLSSTNTYLEKICYGNTPLGDPPWSFEVVFDYGSSNVRKVIEDPEHTHLSNEEGVWRCRKDSFSSYRAGFEIRTRRLVENVLFFHHFPETGSVLARALCLCYQENPRHTSLVGVQEVGFRRKKNGYYRVQQVPEITFSYTPFDTAFTAQGQHFQKLCLENGGSLPSFAAEEASLVDLDGEGIPGIFYHGAEAALYFPPRGGGKYGAAQERDPLPNEHAIANPHYELRDVTGNGKLDFVVRSATRSGFYEGGDNGSWKSFQAFPAYPLHELSPWLETVDVNGDGLTDLLCMEEEQTHVYFSRGKEGYTETTSLSREHGVALLREAVTQEWIGYVDLFGDGLEHRVRVRNGSVECWPNLGYGHFDEPLFLDNAPVFPENFQRERLFFADIDGSGTADMIYVATDHVEVFFNQSGNSLSDAVFIDLPMGYEAAVDSIQFADVLGKGTACLVLRKEREQFYFDFVGGTKPYLLNRIDHGRGLVTEVSYESSTTLYLQDLVKGTPWKTCLPFPVHVVTKVIQHELITDVCYERTFRYRHGYYDGSAREFRGFALVERTDAAVFPVAQKEENPLTETPTLTKTWYHTGAALQDGEWTSLFKDEYFAGDQDAWDLPDSVVEASGPVVPEDVAYALKGTVLREEIYGLDGNPNPYSVTETNFTVRQIQAREENPYGVYLVHERETLRYQYERNPEDPRIQHDFTFAVNPYGRATLTGVVFYPRRASQNPFPQQTHLQAKAVWHNLGYETKDFYRLHVHAEERGYEILGLMLPEKHAFFTWQEAKEQFRAALASPDILPPIPIKSAGSSMVQSSQHARLLSCQRAYYWNEEQTEVLSLGSFAEKALLHHVETAESAATQLSSVFGERIDLKTLSEETKYLEKENVFWNPGLTQFYFTKEEALFYLPRKTVDTFATETNIEYDPAALVPVKVTSSHADNPVALTTHGEIDFYTLRINKLIDINGNTTQAVFDPLGEVIATSTYGHEGKQHVGDAVIDQTQYDDRQPPTFDEVIDDPSAFLGEATTFFYYDLYAWQKRNQPICSISLQRDLHVSQLKPDQKPRIHLAITYSDGLGRVAQQKEKADPGDAFSFNETGTPIVVYTEHRWLSSGRTVYNNKGNPVKHYEPYFIDRASYVDEKEVTEFGVTPILFYDPLGRFVRTETPKGFHSKTDFDAWEVNHYDNNDTVLESRYYKKYRDKKIHLTPDEVDALEKAIPFNNTPLTERLDNQGILFWQIQNNLGKVTVENEELKAIAKKANLEPSAILSALTEAKYLEEGYVTNAFQPYLTDFQLQLPQPYKEIAPELTEWLQGSCLTTNLEHDCQGRLLSTTDPRLYHETIQHQTSLCNLRFVYSLTGKTLYTNSVDAGETWALTNAAGQTLYTWDKRQLKETWIYDWLQRPLQRNVQAENSQTTKEQCVEKWIYGDCLSPGEKTETAQQNNLLGNVVEMFDQAGKVSTPLYDPWGNPKSQTRQLSKNYQPQEEGVQVAWSSQLIDPADEKLLEPSSGYTTKWIYDAFSRVNTESTGKAETSPSFIAVSTYNLLGQLVQNQVTYPDEADDMETVPLIEKLVYNAKGQRKSIHYGNGAQTTYTYDPKTFALQTVETERPTKGTKKTEPLQSLSYTYDPQGNITRVHEDTLQTVFHLSQAPAPRDYTYDALYQLMRATGWEQPGLRGIAYQNQSQFKKDQFIPLPSTEQNKPQTYYQKYAYDRGGNLTSLQHVAHHSGSSWTRNFTVAESSNHVLSFAQNQQPIQKFHYDDSGNMGALVPSQEMIWNAQNRLVQADQVQREDAVSDSEYYAYSASGERVRKVTQKMHNQGKMIQTEEKIYLGNFVVKRAFQNDQIVLERQTFSVRDGEQHVAMIDHWVEDTYHRETKQSSASILRYVLCDQLDSVSLQLDAEAALITFENYFPYGGTSILAGKNQQEVERKVYRYSGKERDEATGLYYYGERYYAPWMGRWIRPDPAGTVDGLNLYAFVNNNPVSAIDIGGMARDDVYGTPQSWRQTFLDQTRTSSGGRTARVDITEQQASFIVSTFAEVQKQADLGALSAGSRPSEIVHALRMNHKLEGSAPEGLYFEEGIAQLKQGKYLNINAPEAVRDSGVWHINRDFMAALGERMYQATQRGTFDARGLPAVPQGRLSYTHNQLTTYPRLQEIWGWGRQRFDQSWFDTMVHDAWTGRFTMADDKFNSVANNQDQFSTPQAEKYLRALKAVGAYSQGASPNNLIEVSQHYFALAANLGDTDSINIVTTRRMNLQRGRANRQEMANQRRGRYEPALKKRKVG